MRWTRVLLELYAGAELAACVQVARRSVDNCQCGWSGVCVRAAWGQVDRGGFGAAGQVMRGGDICSIRDSEEYNIHMVAVERKGGCMCDDS